MFSFNTIPKELKCETTSISLSLIENYIGFCWRRLWKSIHLVFSSFNDNLFTTGKHYRSVLDVNGQYNNSQLIHNWNLTSDRLKNLTSVLSELIKMAIKNEIK